MRSPGRPAVIVVVMSAILSLFAVQPAGAATSYFGANLNGLPFPSNAYPGRYCDKGIDGGNDTYSCTWVETYAYNNNGLTGAKAPRDGTIHKIRLIAGQGGSFRLFLARYRPNSTEAKVVYKGPTITYATDPCNVDCAIQSFNVSIPVHKGDFLAFKTNKASFLRCDSGGDRTALFTPPLTVGSPFQTADATDGCFALLQARY